LRGSLDPAAAQQQHQTKQSVSATHHGPSRSSI
jgi:hypothetical protein